MSTYSFSPPYPKHQQLHLGPTAAVLAADAIRIHLPRGASGGGGSGGGWRPFELLVLPDLVLEVVPLAGKHALGQAGVGGGGGGGVGAHAAGRKLLVVGLWEWARQTLGGQTLVATSLSLAVSYYLQSVLSSVLAAFPPVHSLPDLHSQAEAFVALSPSEKVDATLDKVRAGARAGKQGQAWMMAAYGAFVGGPVQHFMPRLVAFAEALFPAAATATSRRKTLIRLLLKYGLSTPVEIGVWLVSMAYISGARSAGQLKGAVRSGFGSVFKATVVMQALAAVVARRVGEQSTARWAGVLQFVMGCISMTAVKRKARFSQGGASGGGGGGYHWGSQQKQKEKESVSSAAGEEGGAAERGRFPAWQPGVDYAAGDHVCFRGKDYAVQQGHRSQGDWTPDSTPNLFGAMEGASKGPLEKE